MRKLAIITTHPIQYYAPVFQLLKKRRTIDIKVFYTLGNNNDNNHDRGFGKVVKWDIPLLEGYIFEWVQNIALQPGSHNFKGIINPNLINLIKEWNPDAILVFGWAYQSHLKVIRYFKNKIPVYFRGDSTLLNNIYSIEMIVKYIFLKWVYKHVDLAFYVGSNNRDYFKKYGLNDKQLGFAPHAIDNERFKFKFEAESEALRSSFKISKSDILVLYAGKFEEVKNVELLLTAFINLNKSGVHLLLAGSGTNEQTLKARASKCNISDKIHFMDFSNQAYMPVLYQASDMFCLPSISESWGLSVNEAMACGKAILVSDKVGCAVDLVTENYNGCIFTSGNLISLTQKLQQLTNDKKLLIEYGARSQMMIKDWNFTYIAVAIENKLIHETN